MDKNLFDLNREGLRVFPKTPFLILERRKGRRVPIHSVLYARNSHVHFVARVKDISADGIGGQGMGFPPEGAYLDLSFALPGPEKPIACQGILTRTSLRGEWAICFTKKPEPFNHLLQRFMERQTLTGCS